MRKKVLAFVMMVIFAVFLSVPANATFSELEKTVEKAADFLRSNSLTGSLIAAQAIEAEDTNKVTRSGKWLQSGPGTMVVLLSQSEGETLTFSFTGTSIGVVTYKEGRGTATLSIDGTSYDVDVTRASTNCVDNTPSYCEIPIASGLSNTQHTAVLKTTNSNAFHADKFIINTATQPTPSTTTCTDTDGTSYYDYGKVLSSAYSGENGFREDKCESSVVIEQICSGSTPSSIRFTCPNGCENGACKQAANCDAYKTKKYKDGKLAETVTGACTNDDNGVCGYDTLYDGPKCSGGIWKWCTKASQSQSCSGCYEGNMCSTGTTCQASPYYDYNNDKSVTDADTEACNNCIGKYSSGDCWKCDFNGDCAVALSDLEMQKGKKTSPLDCDSAEVKNTKYADGVKTTGDGVSGYDYLSYGPVCRTIKGVNTWYWCTQSTKNTNCWGCYTGNLCNFGTATAEQKADLTVSEIILTPSFPVLNQEATVQVFLKNTGTAASRVLDYVIQYSSEANSYLLTQNPVSNFDGELSIGETATVTSKIKYTKTGQFTITAKVDNNNRISEKDESNNEKTKTVTVSEQPVQEGQQPIVNCNTQLSIRCTSTDSSSITISINPVSGATSYLLEWRKAGLDKWTGCSKPSECWSTINPSTTIKAMELDPYTTYQIRVKIERGNCAGASSQITYCTTKEAQQATAQGRIQAASTQPLTCDALAAMPYADGIANAVSGDIKYAYDILVSGPACENGIVRWCTKSSEKSECAKCDTGGCCGGTEQWTECDYVKCDSGITICRKYNPKYPKCGMAKESICGEQGESTSRLQSKGYTAKEIAAIVTGTTPPSSVQPAEASDKTISAQTPSSDITEPVQEAAEEQPEVRKSIVARILGALSKLFG